MPSLESTRGMERNVLSEFKFCDTCEHIGNASSIPPHKPCKGCIWNAAVFTRMKERLDRIDERSLAAFHESARVYIDAVWQRGGANALFEFFKMFAAAQASGILNK